MTPAAILARELGAPVRDFDARCLAPMLCAPDETAGRILKEASYVFELKLDGVRIVADKRGANVALGYRKLRDATGNYPEIAEAVRSLGEERVVLDGEIIAFDDLGRPDFQRLAQRIQSSPRDARMAAIHVPVVYVVFDVLAVGAYDVRGLPIEARKAILERVLGSTSAHGSKSLLRLHPTFDDGAALFRLCKEHHLEGVVAKRAGSPYRAGERVTDWVKVKHDHDADLVVVGYTEGEGKRSRLGSLDVAAYENGRFVIRGAVGSGLDEDTIDLLLARMRDLEVDRPVASGTYNPKPKQRTRHHVRPEMVVSVRYNSFSREGVLRFPVFRGIRPDVRPEDCTISPRGEEQITPEGPRELEGRGPASRIHLTAPNAALLEDGTTKRALCMHYERVATRLLPFVAERPCIFLRPDSSVADGVAPFWPLPKWTPSWVKTTAFATSGREVRGVLVDDLDTLVFAVEAGCVSVLAPPFHDKDPLRDYVCVRTSKKRAAAARVLAERLGLVSFVKFAQRGMFDVLIPVNRASCEVARPFAALFARLLGGDAFAEPAASLLPQAIREAEDPTTDVQVVESVVAPWAIVVEPGGRARVSAPIAWDEFEGASPCSIDEVSSRLDHDASGEMAAAGAKSDLERAIAEIEKVVAEQSR